MPMQGATRAVDATRTSASLIVPLLALLALMLFAPATARGATYCVASPAGCTGNASFSTVQGAVADARATVGADTIHVGAHTETVLGASSGRVRA